MKNKINYTKEGLSVLAEAENYHYWFITRKEFITNNILKYLPPKLMLLHTDQINSQEKAPHY